MPDINVARAFLYIGVLKTKELQSKNLALSYLLALGEDTMSKSNTQIYELLRNRIVTLEYAPGTLLNELDLSKELNVSRTPVRSALKTLEMDRLVSIVPRYGIQVTQIDFKMMKSLFEMTRILDPYCVRLACPKISENQIKELKDIVLGIEKSVQTGDYQSAVSGDEAFHRLVTSVADNPWLTDELDRLHMHSERLWHYTSNQFVNTDIFTTTFKKIIAAFEKRDEETAAVQAQRHIDDFIESIKDSML